METKYIILEEPKSLFEIKAYGPFSVEELYHFLKGVKETSLTILPLREVKMYGN